jgi:peptidoglycan hydrolase CwlO-like protein
VLAVAGVLAHLPSVVYAAATSTSDAVTTATSTAALQQEIDDNDQQIAALNAQIAEYQTQLQQVGADKKTLQQAIHSLDLQRNTVQARVKATQLQINATQLQIQQLGGEIQDTQATITTEQAGLAEELRILQKVESQSLLVKVLSSGNLAQIWSDTNATLQMQDAIQNKMVVLQAQQDNLANSQAASQQKQVTLSSQQQSLSSQQQSLAATVQSKNKLLAETDAKESTYQKLLAAAQAELNSYTAFTENAGGSKLLIHQTTCDAWGCYYNQRDAAWGNIPLNGTQYKLASDGCLVTAMAMVMTHYGYKDVTPATINSNPGNFAAYYPAYLLITINVDGVSATRKTAAIDATLATGNPVIVGLKAYGGSHYVVLVGGSKGNYTMRDPYIANGKDISFTANYSVKNIFGISKVTIS